MMTRIGFGVLMTTLALVFTARCGRSAEITAAVASAEIEPTPVCPLARGEGNVSPALSIYSIIFVVNDIEQVVRNNDTLEASTGDEVRVQEIILCAQPYTGNGGDVCVDFAPLDLDGREIGSEHRGTHTVRVTPGFISFSLQNMTWSIDDDWSSISAVVNHWPAEQTQDLACGSGRCEHDDWIIVPFR